MKKVFSVLLLCALMLTLPFACAFTLEDAETTARGLAAAEATLVEADSDDGVFEFTFRSDSRIEKIDILASDGSVTEFETRHTGAGRASGFTVTADDARARVSEAYAGAAVGLVLAERDDDDGAVYEVFFTAPDTVGTVALNAETGETVRTELYPAAVGAVIDSPAVEEIVLGRLPGGEIVGLELSWDDGRYEYEGEARADGREYSFEINAATGDVLEWEIDD